MKLLLRGYFWLAERLYHELAWAYDLASWLVSLGHWAGWRKLALNYALGPRVLEIGFGTGVLLQELAQRGLGVFGLDPSPEMHVVARRKLHRMGLHLPMARGRSQQAPFASGSFDSIISTFPAGYILDPETWREAARLLRAPVGRLVVVGIVVTLSRHQMPVETSPQTGRPLPMILSRCKTLAEAAGLEWSVDLRREGMVTVPVILATKSG